MDFLHDLDYSSQNEALGDYTQQAQNLIKAPEQLKKLAESRDAFNQLLTTGTGTVGTLIAHKSLAGLKKKFFDPLFKTAKKEGKSLINQTRDAVGDRLDELTGQGERLQNAIQGQPQADVPEAEPETGLAQGAEADGGVETRPLDTSAEVDEFDPANMPSGAGGRVNISSTPEAPSPEDPLDIGEGDIPDSLFTEPAGAEPATRELGGFDDDLGDLLDAPRTLEQSVVATPGDGVEGGISETSFGPEGATPIGTTTEVAEGATGEGAGLGAEIGSGATAAAETDALFGGPLDLAGDVAGLAVGLGTIIGGLLGEKKAPTPTVLPSINPNVQMGIANY